MNIVTRYVVWELLKILLITLTVMTTVMILVGVIEEAVRENLTPLTILKLLPYVLPNALCFAIPATMLFSTCIVLGRMSGSNELVAIKSMGVSPIRVAAPVFVIAFILSLATVFLNDLAVSWGRQGVYRVVLHSVEKTIYSVLSTQQMYQNGRLSIKVDDVVEKQLVNLVVEYYQDDDESHTEVRAKRAELYIRPESDELVFRLHDAFALNPDAGLMMALNEHEIRIPLRSATKRKERLETPSNLPLRDIRSEIRKQTDFVHARRRQLAMQSAFQMLGGDMISLTHPRWSHDLTDLQTANYRVYRLKTEPWRRWANGFSCLCFVLVGVPLAIRLRRGDFWNTFALAFIPILLAYYPLLMFGVGRAKSGLFPPPSVWLGNLILGAVGWLLLRRILRH